MWGMGMASSYQSCILRPEQRWMRGHIWCGANCWPGHHITITSYLSPSQVSWTWSTSDSGLVLVVTWCVVWQKMGMVHYKKRTVKPESNPSAKDSWLILEADQFVPRVATIRFWIDRDIDRLVVQTVNKLLLLSKELKVKFEPNCDQPAMTQVCLLLESAVW